MMHSLHDAPATQSTYASGNCTHWPGLVLWLFTSRRDYSSYILTEAERGIIIAYEGERSTVVSFCITKSPELAITCLTLLAHDGIATLTDMSYTPQDLLGPVPHTTFSISKKSPPFFELTSTIDPTVSATCRSFACARAIAEAYGPLPGFTTAVESRQSIAHAEEEELSHERRTRRIHHSPV